MPDLDKIVRAGFGQKEVVIVGDLVADQFLNGTISRVSREAPVFILRHESTITRPGAAANAAANVASLGGQAVLIGLVGQDEAGDLLMRALTDAGVDSNSVVRPQSFQTTTKVRVLAGQHYAARQQVIRIDYEDAGNVPESVKATLRVNLAAASATADAIIISDYGYGAVFPEIFSDLLSIAGDRGIPLVVDSRHRLGEYAGATTATPNREEVEGILGKDFTSDDCEALRSRLGFEALLVTNGNRGMTVYEAGNPPLVLSAIGSPEPVDVTGAGDTVIAAYTLALASGMSYANAANIANHAGGIVVMKKGTATAGADELLASLDGFASTQCR